MKIIVFLQSKVEEETSSAGEQLVRNRLYDYTAGKECFGAPFFIPAGNLHVLENPKLSIIPEVDIPPHEVAKVAM